MKKVFLAFLFLGAFTAVNAQKYDLSKVPVLYTIGYAHLDTEWRWDYQTTIKEYIWNTMADNFKLFEKYPDYIFNFSGARRYLLMKEYYPEEFEKVKQYVKAGNWFPAGSSFEENDVLAPSHESMIRQILLGSDFFRKELGVTSNEFILPDCFGYLYSLPSILSHCGIKGFSTQKLTWGSAVGIPFSVGKWIGSDGESIVAALSPGDYTYKVRSDLNGSNWTKRVLDAGAKYGVSADYMYFGVGDVGGSPTEESVMWVDKSSKNKKDVNIIFSTTAQMFDDITPALKEKLPVYKGEFLLTNHSAGSITSAAFMKKMNRKNELLGYNAEASSVIEEWLGGGSYNRTKINGAWNLVLASQFHDILPGTSIPRAYDFAQNDEIIAANQFSAVFADASGSVIKNMNTKVKGVPVVVFNPLGFEREDCVEATISIEGTPKAVKVFNQENDEVPSQLIKVDGNKYTLVFLAKTSPVSYTTFDVRGSEKACTLSTGLKVTSNTLENSKYLVKISAAGEVSSIYDKKVKKELLASPIRLAFQFEKPMDYPAWNMDWADRKSPPTGFVDGTPKIKIVESGPARIVIEVEREARNSKFVEQVRLNAGEACERVEFNTKIDWATKETCLKATFALSVANNKATYNLGVGTIERGNNDSLKFEVPSHQWFDLTDKSGSYGVSVLEDCKYGSDKPSDNTLRLTLLYTPATRGSYMDQAVQDFGKHEILYALFGHKGDSKAANSYGQALRINQPLVAFQTNQHDGSLKNEFSFVEVSSPDVEISALKKAENSDDVIIRFIETKNKEVKNVQAAFASDVVSAKEVNGQEQPLNDAVIKGGKLVFDIAPYHLKTFAVKIKPFDKPAAPLKTSFVDLPYNTDVISNDKHKADGNFGENGKSYPAEMIPAVITSENIGFKMGPKEEGMKNAVACVGQTIKLPAGNFNRLYILAAAADRQQKGEFKINGKTFELPVEYWSGFIGQWDRRIWDNAKPEETSYDRPDVVYKELTPAYLKKENVGFFTTHRHARNGENEAYTFTYMFKYRIDLPENASEITLPVNERIKILAMTAAYNENDNTVPAQILFDDLARDKSDFKRFSASPKPVIIPEKAYVSYSKPLLVAISAADENAEIHYTTDGTNPTLNSPLYAGPVSVDQTMGIKAVSFSKGRLPSVAASGNYSKSLPVAAITYNIMPSTRRGGWERALIDMNYGTAEGGDRRWQNFDKNDLDVVVDLGEKKSVSEINLDFLVNANARIVTPGSVKVSASSDNKDYTDEAEMALAVNEKTDGAAVKKITVPVKKEARYFRIVAKNPGTLPAGFKNAGANAVISVDEITVK